MRVPKPRVFLAHVLFLAGMVAGLDSAFAAPDCVQILTDKINCISVKIYLVEETEACRPNGYRSYGSASRNRCEIMSADDVEEKFRNKKIQYRTDIPPETISLNKEFLKILGTYNKISTPQPSKNVQNRKSIVYLFKWPFRHDLPIKLERKQAEKHSGKVIEFRSRITQGKNQLRWVHHERADALHPNNRVFWKLTLGDHKKSWVFKAY